MSGEAKIYSVLTNVIGSDGKLAQFEVVATDFRCEADGFLFLIEDKAVAAFSKPHVVAIFNKTAAASTSVTK